MASAMASKTAEQVVDEIVGITCRSSSITEERATIQAIIERERREAFERGQQDKVAEVRAVIENKRKMTTGAPARELDSLLDTKPLALPKSPLDPRAVKAVQKLAAICDSTNASILYDDEQAARAIMEEQAARAIMEAYDEKR